MTRDPEGEAKLVRVQSSALSRVNSASLAQRGTQDFFAAEQAERCFREGQEQYCHGEYDQTVLSFKRGLDLNPNHAEMRAFLGDVYTSGLLPQDDYKEAFWHFSIAADQGNAEAQSALAYMYGNGEGVDRDDQRAFFWREKAARQGHPCDQRQLGRMYEHGVGVEQDHQEAIFWYQKAADQGGYFERSQITDLQKAVIGHSGGWCKRLTDQ
jgi:TPR repeat protein